MEANVTHLITRESRIACSPKDPDQMPDNTSAAVHLEWVNCKACLEHYHNVIKRNAACEEH